VINDVFSILGLIQKETMGASFNLNAKEEVQGPEIFHCKLRSETANDSMK
jgi:hypothetical protein